MIKKKKIKKIIILLFIILFIKLVINSESYGATIISKDGNWEYYIKNNVVYLCKYLGTDGTVEIPKTIDGYDVKYINSFTSNETIEHVKIPSTIKRMGQLSGAFQGCKNLKTVEIEEGELESIGLFDFCNCSQLTEINIPSNIKSINRYAFMNCKSLETFNISSGVENIDIEAFAGCEKLSQINIDKNNKNFIISDGILYDYNKAQIIFYPLTKTDKEYSVPNTIKQLQMYNIENSYLEKININSDLTEIKKRAFVLCDGLKEIKVDERNLWYTDIDGVLFNKDTSNLICYPIGKLSNIYVVPDTVVTIEENAFEGNNSLNKLIIRNTVENIEEGAINNCENLVIYCNSGSYAEEYAKENNIDYEIIKGIITDEYIYKINEDNKSCTIISYIGNASEVIIPEKIDSYDVTKIEYKAFFGNENITYVEVPDKIVEIGIQAFSACINLKEISVNTNNSNYISDNGILFNKEKTKLISFPAGKELVDYTIPNTVTEIEWGAFKGNNKLCSININASDIQIGNGAFSQCKQLEKINISTNSRYESEDGVLFKKGKTDLICYPAGKKDKKYEIPNTVTTVMDFIDNDYIEEVVFGENMEFIDGSAFQHCEKLKNVDMSKSKIQYIKSCVFLNCKSLESVKFSEQLRAIYDYAFSNCYALKEIELPDATEYIGIGAFCNCKSLTNINLNNVIRIGDESFKGCTELKEITIPEKVKNILEGAFANCANLEKVIILSTDVEFAEEIFLESPNIIIYCSEGSNAQNFAIKNNLKYELIDSNTKTIKFKDKKLYDYMKDYLSTRYSIIESYNDEDNTIVVTKENMLKVDLINISGKEIEELSGIENFENLVHLYANENKIEDLEPLQNLNKIQFLLLNKNNIKNIDALANLTEIKELQLDNNQITKIDVLKNLNSLERVFIRNNNVIDVLPLDNLSNLRVLAMNNNCYIENKTDINIVKGDKIEINLPSVFKYAKQENSLLYTPDDLVLTNCTLEQDTILLNTDIIGENIATVLIKSGNADETIYRVEYIVKGDNLLKEDSQYEIKNSYLTKINPQTKIEDFRKCINEEYQMKIYDNQEEVVDKNAIIETNMKAIVSKEEQQKGEYILVIKGDCNEDGQADIKDILQINKYRLNKVLLTGANLEAGDVNSDGKVDILDILKINKYRLGKDSL